MTHPAPHVRLDRHIDISRFGCEVMAVGDINGDGKAELVFVQSVGMLTLPCFQPGSKECFGERYTLPEEQALDCVTAIDLQGNILWQRGTPWAAPLPFRTHGGEEMLRACDLDGDGRTELIRIRGDKVETLDGLTGRMLTQASLGAEGYSSIFTARFLPGAARQIFIKPCSDGLPPAHPYGCPVIALDHRLKRLWGPADFGNVGHTPVACDVDGDGLEELLIGGVCVNPDGTVRWSLGDGVTGADGHDDRRTIADIDADGQREQVLAFEGRGLIVSDLRGKVKWTVGSDHCGEAVVGKFHANRPGLQVMMNNEAWRVATHDHKFGSKMVDGVGGEIWRDPRDLYGKTIDWPTAQGPQAIFAKPHAADPPDARPFIMDGSTATIAEFDLPLRVAGVDPKQMTHTNVCWGDWGDYYAQRVVDLPGVGQRLFIWTRRDLWVFELRM